MKKLLLPVALLALSSATFAQKWNVETSQAPYKKATFNIDEGTWMNLDVSPDGQRIVFDLLGDIYSMPIKGGKASLLAGGRAWEVQPRYSPDGKHISFTSDREGGDNIWIMNYDGTGKRAITKESFRLLNNASWSADAQYLVARKHFTAGRSLGAGEMWLYNKNGGDGIQLTKRKNDQQDAGEPILSPDNKYLYWSEDMTPGPSFQYNKDPNEGIYEIRRLNRQTGATETVTGGTGGACRPQISPDGKLMAFVRRVRLKSVLFLHNLQTGEEWPVYDDLSHDQQETWAIFGVYPNFAWTPDAKNIIFYAKGKIRNLDVASLNVTQIPFEVTSTQSYAEALHFPQRVFSEDFAVKMIRQATTSPDGKTIAFNAAGYIYVKQLPSGKPERITNTNELEYAPEFSPDGKSLVYTSWSDELKGSINIIDLNTKAITRLVSEKGFYYTPKFSNKGDKIVYRKGEGNESLGFAFGKNPGIYTVSVTGGATPQLIINNGINPQFSTDDSKIYYQSWENGQKAFRIMDANGANARTLYTSQYATQFAPSPDGKWMAFTELFNCYVTPMVNSGNPQNLSASNKALPLNKLTRDAGTNLHWSRDSKKLMWVLGPRYFARDIKSAFPFIEGDDKTPPVDTVGTDIGLRLQSDLPDGKIAFTNARIITMKGDEVIEKGTIVIERNKIIAVGKDVQAPADAKVYDIAGKTIMPGIIDVHAHLRPSPDGVTPQQDWSYYANLAYGVTTAHDPSSNTEMVFSQNEMLRSGRMVGPRVYSTGSILYGADGDFKVVINSLEDARSHLRRLKAVGAFSVKSYNQPRREQRQQVIEAARDLQMEVVPEGGSTFFNNMNQILDGHTGIEHNIPVYPVYKDVREFWNASKTAYTPTLIVSYGTQFGETYWYARNDIWKNDHLLSYTPMSIIDARSRRRIISEYGDYGHIDVSRAVKQIASGGTKINLGAHGQIQGIGAHWELWMLAQGGMTPLQSIRCATINGAAYLGMDKEIGSLEPGKLADLVVINENPLDDIRNSEKIKYTMVNGRLYDVDSMNEIGNREKPRLQFWWQMNRGEMSALPVGNTETYQYMSEIDDN